MSVFKCHPDCDCGKPLIRGAAEAVRPVDLVAYLGAKGWIKGDSFRERADIWSLPESAEGILVPRTNDWPDYARRVAECVAVVAELENRPVVTVWRDITHSSHDSGNCDRDE